MAANEYGMRLWDENGLLVFDTTDYTGQYVGSITITGAPGYTPTTFTVPGVPDDSYVWVIPTYYNAEFQDYEGSALPVNRTQFQYFVGRAPAGCITRIDYGFV